MVRRRVLRLGVGFVAPDGPAVDLVRGRDVRGGHPSCRAGGEGAVDRRASLVARRSRVHQVGGRLADPSQERFGAPPVDRGFVVAVRHAEFVVRRPVTHRGHRHHHALLAARRPGTVIRGVVAQGVIVRVVALVGRQSRARRRPDAGGVLQVFSGFGGFLLDGGLLKTTGGEPPEGAREGSSAASTAAAIDPVVIASLLLPSQVPHGRRHSFGERITSVQAEVADLRFRRQPSRVMHEENHPDGEDAQGDTDHGS
mmetsp:Transcript_4525/g.11674  ORF Transcript_4525/g.11674 Transcript_4525/m.11674 type:complete len:255 (+) Transcript_4525:333-1097(+)